MDFRSLTVLRHTCNFEIMCRFYGDTLGMRDIERWARPGSRGAVYSPAGAITGATVEVLELDGVGVPGVAPVNVVLTMYVDDARAAHDQLMAAGLPIARELEDTPWGHRSFGIDDPDGLRIWIVQDMTST